MKVIVPIVRGTSHKTFDTYVLVKGDAILFRIVSPMGYMASYVGLISDFTDNNTHMIVNTLTDSFNIDIKDVISGDTIIESSCIQHSIGNYAVTTQYVGDENHINKEAFVVGDAYRIDITEDGAITSTNYLCAEVKDDCVEFLRLANGSTATVPGVFKIFSIADFLEDTVIVYKLE